jgi:hypothetical protein
MFDGAYLSGDFLPCVRSQEARQKTKSVLPHHFLATFDKFLRAWAGDVVDWISLKVDVVCEVLATSVIFAAGGLSAGCCHD